MRGLLLGAAAGTAATVPMTVYWEVMHNRLPGEPPRPLPPREVVEALAVKAGVSRQLSETDIEWLALAAHVGYGAVTGALFGAMAPSGSRAVGAGMLFGIGVWAASYLGWLPAAGVRHSPRYDVPARTALILTSHLVWGAATGLLLAGRRK
jgi:uncharacterized membrane protein YagU involved in acid resistance